MEVIAIIIGIIFGLQTEAQDVRAHMDGPSIVAEWDTGFAGVTYIRERATKSDLRCWSGMFYDYERAEDEAGPTFLGLPASLDTECYIR